MLRMTTALLLLLAATQAHAQIAAAIVVSGNEGVLRLDEHGNGVFAVWAMNLGRTPGFPVFVGGPCGWIAIEAHGALATGVCNLDTATGACADAARSTLTTRIEHGAIGVYGVLVGGAVEDRITVTFTEYSTVDPAGLPFRCAFPNVPPLIVAERGAVSVQVQP